ncbi:MAG: histidine--tRNA ligase [Legionellales bacterium]|nr:histidine--tRNA ligase [Legionellales bacterium]OUX67544.1 MAG: histidine--tRNA ligase [bacterium TMED178]|tara:strand:- start:3358 stop:4593 length:1236 start_codon:yes stop_codon:yes gene_type:complete
MTQIQSIRGIVDQFPAINDHWDFILEILISKAKTFGFGEIKLPILEKELLFVRSVGQQSDIVQKEMYAFEDQGNERISLRPEGTASCMRAYLNHCQRDAPFQRLWYFGPMFRRERPQKGRQRQFYQFGLEIIGYPEFYPDIELLLYCHEVFKVLSIDSSVRLEINYLPKAESRAAYTDALKEFFKPHIHAFDEIHRYRYENNILRLLDTKDENILKLIQSAPQLSDYYSPSEKEAFKTISDHLTDRGISFKVNHRLVRGLDYYSGLVYEWITDELGAQGTICAGGRYDGLSEQLGGSPVGATGLSIGMERLASLVAQQNTQRNVVYLVANEPSMLAQIPKLVQTLTQQAIPYFVHYHCSQKKKQIKRAQKYGARWLGIVNKESIEMIDLISDNGCDDIPVTQLKEFYASRT